MSDAEVSIRAYRPTDRDAVRHICFETGYMGDPIDGQWRDEASFADVFCGYYIDHEADSAYVAVRDGVVHGYLLGCTDATRLPDPIRAIAPQVLRRGLLFRPGTAGFLWRGISDALGDLRRGHAAVAPVLDDRWPAHLHIDLMPAVRGSGVGRRLIERWIQRLQDEGVAGCHLETMAENVSAIAFFERMGFERRGEPTPMVGMRAAAGGRLHVQLMVQQW